MAAPVACKSALLPSFRLVLGLGFRAARQRYQTKFYAACGYYIYIYTYIYIHVYTYICTSAYALQDSEQISISISLSLSRARARSLSLSLSVCMYICIGLRAARLLERIPILLQICMSPSIHTYTNISACSSHITTHTTEHELTYPAGDAG